MAEPKKCATHEREKETHLDSLAGSRYCTYKSVIALCRAGYFIFFWTTVTTSKQKWKTRTEKTRPDQLSPRLDSLVLCTCMYVCTQLGWFIMTMRAFPLKWEIHAPFARYSRRFSFEGGDVYCLSVLPVDAPICLPCVCGGDVPSSFTPCLSRKTNETKIWLGW